MGERLLKETFISRLREELLNRGEVFANLKAAQVLAGDYREHYNHGRLHGALGCLDRHGRRPPDMHYNHDRLHGALGYLSPMEFAELEKLSGQSSGPRGRIEEVAYVPRLSS